MLAALDKLYAPAGRQKHLNVFEPAVSSHFIRRPCRDLKLSKQKLYKKCYNTFLLFGGRKNESENNHTSISDFDDSSRGNNGRRCW
jgi:hypothetical protein